jgi:hypothetical protein
MQHVRFKSHNPYADRLPNYRVITRETLELMKTLQLAGYNTVVEPQNNNPIALFSQKDVQEFLSNPVNVVLIGIPISIITGVIANWLFSRFNRIPTNDEVHILIETDENGRRVRYDHTGKEITDERFKILSKMINANYNAVRPFPTVMSKGYPAIPIYLEHTTKVVGWIDEIVKDTEGLRVKGAHITDDETLDRIKEGELKGWSIGGLMHKGMCTICGQDYLECLHIAGHDYDGKSCSVRIDNFSIAEISVVKDPAQPLAKIEIIQ